MQPKFISTYKISSTVAAILFFVCLGGPLLHAEKRSTFASDHTQWLAKELAKYQLGDQWDKEIVDDSFIEKNPSIEALAYATAKIKNGATGFYVGVYNDQHLLVTNYHVCPHRFSCLQQVHPLEFTLLGLKIVATDWLGAWEQIDLAVLVIAPSADEAELLAKYAQKFNFHEPTYQHQPLMTAGYGQAANPKRELAASLSEHCKVFSDEYRLLHDSDEINPENYEAWSFASACDISHGDSGSAVADRETGLVVGVIWTGTIPRPSEVKSDTFLDGLIASKSEAIWTSLTYAVPSDKIYEFLLNLLDADAPELSLQAKESLRTWLADQ